jgi:pimeloyl-ACP methyl ester carboxylesterase
LVASFARNPHPWAGFLRGLVLRSWVVSLFPALAHAKALLGGYATPALRTLLRRAHAGLPAAVLARRLRAVATCDVRAELQTLSMPLLYLRSRRDLVVPARNAGEVLRLARNAREVVIDGPHLALATNPQASAAALTAFVRDGLGR